MVIKRKISLILPVLMFLLFLPGCSCVHQWTDASCTAAKTCSLCGATEGAALGHTWIDTDAGKTCRTCGAVSEIPGNSNTSEPESTAASKMNSAVSGHIVYVGATMDFMLPLEEHSWDREYKPEFVMLHFTSVVVTSRNDPFNMDKIRDVFYDYDVSIHYIVERNGTVRCYIPEDRVAWHAGEGTYGDDPKYTNKMNYYAIGIEIVAIGSQDDMAQYLTPEEYAALDEADIGYTPEQYAALQALVADICQRYDIPMDREHILGHSDYSPGKADPGALLDWSKILSNGN